MSDVTKTEATEYSRLENGIHLFKFNESSIKAVDAWITKTDEITRDTPANETIRYLYDQTTSGMQPANYAFRKSQEMLKKYPTRAKSRTVFLVNKGFFTSLMDTFIKLLRTQDVDTVRFIDAKERDEAVAWLLRDD